MSIGKMFLAQNCVTSLQVIALCVLQVVGSARVFVYPYGHCLNSHLLTMEKVVHVLVTGGHHVTMLVPDSYTGPYVPNANFTNVDIIRYSAPTHVEPMCGFKSLKSFMSSSTSDLWHQFQASTLAYCEAILQNKELTRNLKASNFDLAIFEHVDYCSRILADYIDIPFISLVSQGIESVYPRTPTYMPTILCCYTDHMSMVQRLKNTLIYAFQKLFVALTLRKYEALKQKYDLNTTNSLQATPDKAAIKFVLGHHVVDYPGPLLPSTVLLGNLDEVVPPSPLPTEIEQFLDQSPEGVVYLSFGSMIHGWDPEWQRFFVDAFQELPYRILWKHGGSLNESLGLKSSISSKIKLVKWAPQPEILKHPNVKVFVTHSGLNSALEVSKAGKAVVAIPLFADQFYQAKKLVHRAKIGVELDIRTLTSDGLASAILSTAQNEYFKNNAKQISKLIQNPVISDDKAILYWSEFVMKHQGAHHLRSRVQSMTWYEVMLLDVMAFGLSLAIIVLTCLFILYRKLFNLSSQSKSGSSCNSTSHIHTRPKAIYSEEYEALIAKSG